MVQPHPNRTSRYSAPRSRPIPGHRPRNNPDVKPWMVWKKNLTRALIVVVIMVVATIVSIKALRMQWSRTDRRLNPPAAPVAPLPSPTPVQAGPAPEMNLTEPDLLATDATNRFAFLLRRAEMLQANGDHEEAMTRYEDALMLVPDHAPALAALGRLLLLTGQHEAAADKLRLAVEHGPPEPDLLNNLGTARLQLGDNDQALADFIRITETFPDFDQAWFNAGVAALRVRRPDEAASLFRAYAERVPDDARPLRELARIAWNNDKPDQAFDLLDQAMALDPDWHLPYLDAALMAARAGDDARAFAYLSSAEPLTDPASIYQLLQRSVFKDLRRTQSGRDFERQLAQRAREQLLDQASGAIDAGAALP